MKRSCKVPNAKELAKKVNMKMVEKYFDGMNFYILPSRFGPQRLKIFEKQVTNNGGELHNNLKKDLSKITHIIVEETVDKDTLLHNCNVSQFTNAKFLKCTWLTQCLKNKNLVPLENFIMYEHSSEITIESVDNKHSDNTEAIDARVDDDDSQNNLSPSISNQERKSSKYMERKFIKKFACAHSSVSSPSNLNEHITCELEKLSSAYESRKDTWRALGYQRAISAIKNHPQRIETWEEAKSIRGVGERLADKIKEILESGQLRKVKEVCENEETKTLELFLGVWGAGPTTANNWYVQGFRSLDDLKMKANLTKHQVIGLNYYEELNERMQRSEVEEIEREVASAAEAVKKGLLLVVCGSYRRDKSTCGDVDILLTHPDGVSHENIFKPLLGKLKENGFLTDDLVIIENNGNQQKYLGVCRLPGPERKHRRLDIIIVPYNEFAPAIMYFTGSAHFNRSMRLLATKLGMSLSEHGLRAGIIREGSDFVTGGSLLHTPSEESIFEHLGLKYLPPNERNH